MVKAVPKPLSLVYMELNTPISIILKASPVSMPYVRQKKILLVYQNAYFLEMKNFGKP